MLTLPSMHLYSFPPIHSEAATDASITDGLVSSRDSFGRYLRISQSVPAHGDLHAGRPMPPIALHGLHAVDLFADVGVEVLLI